MVQQEKSRKIKAAVKSEASVNKINTRGCSGAAVKSVDSTHKKNSSEGKSVNLVGKVFITKEEHQYIKKISKKMSIDDPTLVVCWFDDVVDGVVLAALADKIPVPATGAPAPPHFLDTSSARNFKDSVHEHLRQVGGGRFGNVIGGNTAQQYQQVITRLVHIEMDPYIQWLTAFAETPLATTARISDRGAADPQPCYALAPPAPMVQVFE